MGILNRILKKKTHEGAPSPTVSPLAQLERSVLSCMLWETEFYEDGQTIAQRIADLVTRGPAADVARVATQAKQEMRLRHVPLLLTRELMRTKEGREQAKNLFPRVILRPDDITEFLAIYWKDNKDEPLAKQVKRHLGETFRTFDAYQLAKYNGGQKAVKLRDALRITRPKPNGDAQADLWRRLVKGELATPDTWEVELSKGGDKKASWGRLLAEDKLGGLAMLRNVRNMTKVGVEPDTIRNALRAVKTGRLLPINFIASARHNPQFEPELEAKFHECFAGRTKLKGKTVITPVIDGHHADFVANAMLGGELPVGFLKVEASPDVVSAVTAVGLGKADAAVVPGGVTLPAGVTRIAALPTVSWPILIAARGAPADVVAKARDRASSFGGSGAIAGFRTSGTDGYRGLARRMKRAVRQSPMVVPNLRIAVGNLIEGRSFAIARPALGSYLTAPPAK